MAQVVLCTGGNLGDPAENLAKARARLTQCVGVERCASSVWVSEPWGFCAECNFLNQVLVLDTDLSAEEVLDRCLQVEQALGRVRKGSGYESRTMDVDILFYDDSVIHTSRLEIPHPRIAERLFVLNPLAEVLPDFIHPLLGVSIIKLRQRLQVSLEKKPGGQ